MAKSVVAIPKVDCDCQEATVVEVKEDLLEWKTVPSWRSPPPCRFGSVFKVRRRWLVEKMLSIGYSWFQLYCGVSYPTLASPDRRIQHAPYGWFAHLRSFLSRSDISIDLPTSLLRTPLNLRRGDLNLMEAFSTLGWKTPKMRLLNNCRLYLQIETLAEISTSDGSRIIPNAWNGQTLPASSTLLWPRQTPLNSWAPHGAKLSHSSSFSTQLPPTARPTTSYFARDWGAGPIITRSTAAGQITNPTSTYSSSHLGDT